MDNYDRYVGGTEVTHALETISLASAQGWQVKSGDLWVDATDSPTTPNSSPSPKHYRRITEWDSTTKPNGCNGEHTVRTVDSGGAPTRIWFTDGLPDARPHGPHPLSANVTNLHIDRDSVSCNNGTIDYFKYDPEAEDDLADPTITFTFDDAELLEGCHYKWIIYIWRTGHDTGDPLASVSNTATAPGEVVAHLTDDTLLSYLPGGFEWGTYTYDIYVLETTGNEPVGEEHDRYGLKTPYSMEVTEHEMDIVEDEVRVKYEISHAWSIDAESIEIVTMDWHLDEKGPAPAPCPTEHDVWHEGPNGEGIPVYTIDESDDSLIWRAIWTGSDPSGVASPYRRTHDAQRMVAVNITKEDLWALYIHRYGYVEDYLSGNRIIGHSSGGCTDPGWCPACSEEDEGGYGFYGGAWMFGFYPDVYDELGNNLLIGGVAVPAKLEMHYVDAPDMDPLETGEPPHEEHASGFEFPSLDRREGCRRILRYVRDYILVQTPAARQKLHAAYHARDAVNPRTFSETDMAVQFDYNTLQEQPTYNCAKFAWNLVQPPRVDYAATPYLLQHRIMTRHDQDGTAPAYLMGLYYWAEIQRDQDGDPVYDANGKVVLEYDEIIKHCCTPCSEAWRGSIRAGLTRPDGDAVGSFLAP